jgi:hypothetical protein
MMTKMTRIRTSRFQPFQSRVGVDTVLRLEFSYDPELIGHLKRLLSAHKSKAIDPARHVLQPGGFLPSCKSWFCEQAIWPEIKEELQQLGYHIQEPQP